MTHESDDETKDAGDPRVEVAWQALEAGDVAAARQQAEALEAGAPETLLLLAACDREAGEDVQAVATLRRAVASDREWATPELWLAEMLAVDPSTTGEALEHAARALDLADDEGEFLAAATLKAGLEVESGEVEEAKQTLAELPPADVRLEDLDLALEIADLHLAVGDAEGAQERLRVICEASPSSADAWYALGCAAGELGDAEGNLTAWKQAWTLDAAPRDRAAGGDRLSESEIVIEAEAALEELPARARELLRGIPIVVVELPAEDDIDAGVDPRALGLFSGTPHGDGATALGGQSGLTQIALFRRNLERTAGDEEELREEIRTTLLHETGHFFGLSDAALEELGLG